MATILIVDKQFIIHSRISRLLENEIEGAQVFGVNDFQQAINACSVLLFDLVLMDINLRDCENYHMIHLRKLQKDIKILIFTAYEENIYAFQYIQDGAHGYLSKANDNDTIINAVKMVLEGGKYISSAIMEKLITFSLNKVDYTNPLERLTCREFEIAELLGIGLKNVEIARRFHLTKATVSGHKINIFRKMHITNIIQLSEIFQKFTY